MLAPEVWSFPAPSSNIVIKQCDIESKEDHSGVIGFHSFNHQVSVVIPNTLSVPVTITDALLDDCDYYKICGVNIAELVDTNFVEAFVRQGKLTALSDNTRIDVDDCIAVIPSGLLILSFNLQTYHRFGLEGKPSFFQRQPDKYVIHVDLKAEYFKPGKKNYERVVQCLKNQKSMKFDLLVSWDPPEDKICPSSVAAYFSEKGYSVQLCQPVFTKRINYNVLVPTIYTFKEKNDSDVLELLEWLGAYSIGAELNTDSKENFLCSYEVPGNCKLFGQAIYMSWAGYFTTKPILKLYDVLRNYIEGREDIPWISLHVQGFMDCPVNWKTKENGFFTNGDNHYTIFLQKNKGNIICQVIGTNKRYKK